MDIIITNDGKSKAQSCEAKIQFNSPFKYWGYYECYFVGYGGNEWSAKMQLIDQINNLISELNKLKESEGQK